MSNAAQTKVLNRGIQEAGVLTTTDRLGGALSSDRDLNIPAGAGQSDIFSSVSGEFTGSFTGTLPTHPIGI